MMGPQSLVCSINLYNPFEAVNARNENKLMNRSRSSFALLAAAFFAVATHSNAATNVGSVSLPGNTSATVTLTMDVAGTLGSIAVRTQGVANLDFTNAGGGTCAVNTAYAAGATCTVIVNFTPMSAGLRLGAVVLNGTSGNVIATSFLKGTGLGPQIAFMPPTETTFGPSGSGNSQPCCMVVDGAGNVYIAVTNSGQNLLQKYTLNGNTYTASNVSINGRSGSLALDSAGNFYINSGNTIFKETLTPSGYAETTVTTTTYTFDSMTIDSDGILYYSDILDGHVYKEVPSSGTYTQTLVLDCSTPGLASCGSSVAVDSKGNLFVSSTGSSFLIVLTPSAGGYTKTYLGSGFYYAWQVVADKNDNIYVADAINNRIVKETLSNGTYTQSVIPTSPLNFPEGVAVDSSGNIYIADTQNNRYLKESVSQAAPLAFATTQFGAVSSDSPKTVTVSNIGSTPLQFSAVVFPADFPEISPQTDDCTVSIPLATADSCTLTFNFLPTNIPGNDSATVSISETASVTSNSLNIAGTTQTIALSGSETRAADTVNLVSSLNPIHLGSTLALTAAVAPATSTATPTGTISFYSGSSLLGTVALTNGVAILHTSALAKGVQTLTATYSGDGNYMPATSNALSQIVGLLLPTVTVSGPAGAFIGTPVTFTTSLDGGSGNPVPTGTITFFSGATNLGFSTLSACSASQPVTFTTAGQQTITASYSGDANYAPTLSSNGVVETITLAQSAGAASIPTGATASVTVSIPSIVTLSSISVVTQGVTGLDFTDAGGGTCTVGAAYVAGSTCTVRIHFAPTYPGPRYGAILLKDSTPGTNIFATVYLQGTALAPQIGLVNNVRVDLGRVPIYPYNEDEQFSTFSSYGGLAFDPTGSIYVASQFNGALKWAHQPDGSSVEIDFDIGTAAASGPGIAIDGSGNIYLACGSSICKETPTPSGGYTLSTVASGFNAIFGLAVDGGGNLYLSDTPMYGSHPLYKGALQPDGSYLFATIPSALIGPGALAVDSAGNVFASDGTTHYSNTSSVVKETPSGNSYTESTVDATLDSPLSIALDWSGNVYSADSGYFYQQNIRKCVEYESGFPALVKESLQPDGSYLATRNFSYQSPNVVAFDGAGNMYVVDSFATCYDHYGELYKIQIDNPTPPAVAFGSVLHGTTTSPQTIAFTNYGNTPLNFSSITFPAHFPKATPAAGDCAAGTPLAPGANCNVSFYFKATDPLNGGLSLPFNETITIASDSFKRSQQTILVSGTEIATVNAAPVFSLAAGTYPSAQTLTITESTAGATVYYTTDGTTPTAASLKYTAPINVGVTETITAVAILAGNSDSPLTSAHYLIQQPAAAPLFSVATGTYANTQNVTITDASPGVTIYYTINGTTPTTGSYKYTTPVAIRNTATLKAMAVGLPNYYIGPIASATYTLAVAVPVMTPPAGTYSGTQTISITDATTAAHIFYTTNGTTPSANSTPYTAPITVSASETIKAYAIATGYTPSAIASAAYVILGPPAPPTFSVAAGTYNNPPSVTITDSVPGTTFYYSLNGTTPTTASTKYTAPIVVKNTATLKAIAVSSGYPPSAVTSATYTLVAATPMVSPAGGTYTGARTVTITTASTGALLFYTTNGATPTAASTKYAGPITISASETLKVIAAATGYTSSPVVTNTYTIH